MPRAASAAEMRACAWSGGTVTSMRKRWRGSSWTSVCWSPMSPAGPRVGDVVLIEVEAEDRRPERAHGRVVKASAA